MGQKTASPSEGHPTEEEIQNMQHQINIDFDSSTRHKK
jgi:hypothetical protein